MYLPSRGYPAFVIEEVCVPWVQPSLCCGGDEEPRSCREPAAARPAGGGPAEGGSSLEGTALQEWLHPGCRQTFALGVCVLNRLLSTVKAQPKYLKCIAFTSLVLAAKINEEDEVIGSVQDLVVQSGCSFSTAEILRMERIILDKLQWDLYTATAVDFIHIFHALLVSGHPHLVPSIGLGSASDPGSPAAGPGLQKRPAGLQAALWTRQVQHCMACHQLWQFKGSTLALAIITLELEVLTPDWFSVFTNLLTKAQVDSGEFIHCKEMVDEYLQSLEFSLPPNAVYIFNSALIPDQQRAWNPTLRLRRGRGGLRTAGGHGRVLRRLQVFVQRGDDSAGKQCRFPAEKRLALPASAPRPQLEGRFIHTVLPSHMENVQYTVVQHI
ncbi:hypothetical protein CesoFtcFv8_016359 [Champsocephalus esox]|uniref:Cyclin N-terminal domain-containing protein n=1 Tax=Champsocephalus esox TaxID=159716 RepID=A0AAN8BPT2_9TELE|nr:hypothetical protein CesoFtcFv8_016359 [Champsocephalus esox]